MILGVQGRGMEVNMIDYSYERDEAIKRRVKKNLDEIDRLNDEFENKKKEIGELIAELDCYGELYGKDQKYDELKVKIDSEKSKHLEMLKEYKAKMQELENENAIITDLI